MEEEKIFFQEKDIKITNRRAIFGSKTYAMSNITSVSMEKKEPSTCFPIVVMVGAGIAILIGIINVTAGDSGGWTTTLIGVIIAALAYLAIKGMKPDYVVQIGDASGSKNAFQSLDKEFIKNIVNAMNEAIVG